MGSTWEGALPVSWIEAGPAAADLARSGLERVAEKLSLSGPLAVQRMTINRSGKLEKTSRVQVVWPDWKVLVAMAVSRLSSRR